ncbi:MAG: discoidin domain-containing protein [Planctomycetaceae bacterium]|jgi:hypothetical protein|nr:discoidin domain-containing protein [Planctomycetaceae bacterium]
MYQMITRKLLFIVILLFPIFLLAEEKEQNIALGKKYTLSPKPNYRHCTDEGDLVQLTDGQTTKAYFWTQKGTVGWRGASYAEIEIDLEKIEPINKIELTTAMGPNANVYFPIAVYVLVSDDKKTYKNIGDLMFLDLKVNKQLPHQNYGIQCLSSGKLSTRGRYVRVVMITRGFSTGSLFTDEIRIFRGDDALLQKEPDGTIINTNTKLFVEQQLSKAMFLRRHQLDILLLRKILKENSQSINNHNVLVDRINSIENRFIQAASTPEFTNLPKDFKTIFPISDYQNEVFQTQAAIWKSTGLTFLTKTVSPWDKTPLFAVPSQIDETKNKIDVYAMQGEYRAAAFNLYNALALPVPVRIRLEGIPETEFSVHDVLWTDTNYSEPILAALPEITSDHGNYSVTVLPGLVKQVYLTFCPKNLPPKLYEGKIIIESADTEKKLLGSIPLSLHIFPIKFPEKTSLLVGGWSNTNDIIPRHSVTLKNRPEFLKHLQERFVNAPWATHSALFSFTIDNDLKNITLNTKEMDDWLTQWQNAQEYCLFLNVDYSTKNSQFDSPQFEQIVSLWISAWVKHWRSKGIEPERINLLLIDEPGHNRNIAPLIAWANVIRKTEPKVKIWEDPIYSEDLPNVPKDVFELSDVFCINRPQWVQNETSFNSFYLDWQKKGKQLQLYSCSGPARLLDPYSYYRLQAWQCAKIGATGSFFWAFGDANGGSSWNEYGLQRAFFTPLFLDPESETVTGGKQMEGIREGIEDFETIKMLRDLIEKRKAENKPIGNAETVLRESIDMVLKDQKYIEIYWYNPKDRTIADTARIRILEEIVRLNQ